MKRSMRKPRDDPVDRWMKSTCRHLDLRKRIETLDTSPSCVKTLQLYSSSKSIDLLVYRTATTCSSFLIPSIFLDDFNSTFKTEKRSLKDTPCTSCQKSERLDEEESKIKGGREREENERPPPFLPLA